MMLTSILLAGGENKRMNRFPKWQLTVNGETMLERSIEKLSTFSQSIIIVSGGEYIFPEEILNKPNVSLVYDQTPFLGPLNGILTALEHSNADYHFLVAADMPFFSSDLAQHMYNLALKESYDMVIPVWSEKLQPLHAIYHKDLQDSIKKDISDHKYKLIKWILNQPNTYFLQEEEIKSYNQDSKLFFNMNTPEEYKLLDTLFFKEEKE